MRDRLPDEQGRQEELLARFDRLQRRALIVGGVGLLLVLIGAFFNLNQFFRSYLFAYVFWLGISLGCLAWLLVHQLTGGRWGFAILPLLQSSAFVIGWAAILFIPLLFGLDHLYAWARPEAVAQDYLLQHKQPYLNVPFFIGRAVLYFVIWGGSIYLFQRWWRGVELHADPVPADRLRRFSGPAFAIYGLTVTFGSFDWLMSLDAHWFSTIFGVLIGAGQVVSALAFVIAVAMFLTHVEPRYFRITAQQMQDLGNLLLVAVIFFTYIAFIQYFVIWSGNLPENVPWYLQRLRGGWEWIAVALLVFHFVVPFVLLLSSAIKRNPRRLGAVALLVMIASLLHHFWLVAPAFSAIIYVNWLDVVMPLFLGAAWIFIFVRQLRRHDFVPVQDPAWQEGHILE